LTKLSSQESGAFFETQCSGTTHFLQLIPAFCSSDKSTMVHVYIYIYVNS